MQLDLSTLSTAELRSLLDSARGRGQAAQSYEILQEMARRRESGETRRPFAPRRPTDPHIISLDLGDPLDRLDEFAEPEAEPVTVVAPLVPEPPTRPQPAAEPARPDLESELEPILSADVDPLADLTLEREPRPAPRPARRRAPVAGFLACTAAGLALGVWIGPAAQSALSSYVPALRAQRTAAVQPAPTGPQLTVAVESNATDLAVAPGPASALETLPAEAPAEPAAAAPASEAAPAPPPVTPEIGQQVLVTEEHAAAADETSGCTGATTPADRTICADPELQRLQRDLRTAYAQALDAHADRALLRERQLAWRDARNEVADAEQLARLYRARIQKLNAATADARRARAG